MIRLKQKYIYATLAYADVFDYPLTHDELRRWMIMSTSVRFLKRQEKYLTLPGRMSILQKRKEREIVAQKKWEIIRRLVGIFSWLPTINLVGVTGGLAMNNAKVTDDIDLIFITRRGTIWITRCIVTVLADVLGKRRRPHERFVQNKICLNMFMSEDALSLSQSERDLFSAHEVLQMVPIFHRGNTYQTFLSANRWVKDFLPNAWKEKNAKCPMPNAKLNHIFSMYHLAFIIIEPIVRLLQLWYMRKHRTTEVIESGVLRFHPRDARIWIKKKFAIRLKQYNIPLDNIFYHR